MKSRALIGLICLLMMNFASAETLHEMRGDQGVLTDFRPNGAVWLSKDRLLVCDLRFNNMHIFDLEGRRYHKFNAPDGSAPVQYVGLARLKDGTYMAVGSHYHEKNHVRYRKQRSQLHKFRIVDEYVIGSDFDTNYSPVESFRKLRIWGMTPERQMEIAGMVVDEKRNTVWFGLRRPQSEKGHLSLLRCSFKELLEQKEDAEVREIDTGWTLPMEERCQLPSYLTDLAMLDDGSFLFLVTAEDMENDRLCANSLWRWRPGRPATLVKKDIALQNRATGLAVRSLGKGQYQVALVCDNNTEETQVPPRLVVFSEPLTLR